MEELRKVRACERPPGQLTEVLLVLDATTGQNRVVQARQFTEAVGVTGMSHQARRQRPKGGVVLSDPIELGLPIKTRRSVRVWRDLVPFESTAEFVNSALYRLEDDAYRRSSVPQSSPD